MTHTWSTCRTLPVVEDADAVAEAQHGLELVEHRLPGEVPVDVLPHPVARLDVESDPHDDPERAEPDDQALEVRIAAAHRDELAAMIDVLERGDRPGEHPIADARAVGAGGDCARDRDVRQRAHVVQSPAVILEPAGEHPVPDAAADRDRAGRLVEHRVGVDARHGDESAGRVGEIGERMARAEGANSAARARRRGHDILHLDDRGRRR